MHLGVIPDGNRRYASEEGIDREEAYRQSKEVIIDILKNHDQLPEKIEEITFYLLSEENLRRDREELGTLFSLLQEHMEEVMERINGNGSLREAADTVARRDFEEVKEAAEDIGENNFSFNWRSTKPGAVPDEVSKKMRMLEEKFSDGDIEMNALISYTGKKDIVEAAKEIHSNGGDFDRENLKKHLEVDSDIDLVIRTGDNPRRECISGFPIWNASYAEYYHIRKHFPEVETGDVVEAIEHYKELRRKKGK